MYCAEWRNEKMNQAAISQGQQNLNFFTKLSFRQQKLIIDNVSHKNEITDDQAFSLIFKEKTESILDHLIDTNQRVQNIVANKYKVFTLNQKRKAKK